MAALGGAQAMSGELKRWCKSFLADVWQGYLPTVWRFAKLPVSNPMFLSRSSS
jgi:hypothetical protein